MCDHGAESQDDRRGEMRVRCKQPSAGALGISAVLIFQVVDDYFSINLQIIQIILVALRNTFNSLVRSELVCISSSSLYKVNADTLIDKQKGPLLEQ